LHMLTCGGGRSATRVAHAMFAAEKEHSFDLAVAYQRAQQKPLLADLHGQSIPVYLTPGTAHICTWLFTTHTFAGSCCDLRSSSSMAGWRPCRPAPGRKGQRERAERAHHCGGRQHCYHAAEGLRRPRRDSPGGRDQGAAGIWQCPSCLTHQATCLSCASERFLSCCMLPALHPYYWL
jgi:hypothetical protein